MSLSATQERFVLHWGEMGARWGINRSVAQIHALLFLAGEPIHAEAIVDTLGIARSNVSTSLRELTSWGLVRVVHELGDRRDHFETLTDPWTLFRTIVRERKRREIDPTIEVLRALAADAADEPAHVQRRLEDLVRFFDATGAWYDAVDRLPDAALRRFVALGDKLPALVRSDR